VHPKDSRYNKLPDRIGADEEKHESTKRRKHEKCGITTMLFRAFVILFSKPGNLLWRDS